MFKFTMNSYDDVRRFAEAVSIPGIKGRLLAAAVEAWRRPRTAAESGRCAFVSQIFCGMEPTFDIQVDHPDHLFVLANGLVVSNSEPITQASISSKHSGGVAGASAGAIGGFKAIDAAVQAPKVYPGGGTHAQKDGRVDSVREAPQGGWYVGVGGEEHYVHPQSKVTAKAGDTIEAGDLLSEGEVNPAEIVRHKGIGEGRRHYADAFHRLLKNSGVNAHRRNVELLARGLINHVRLTDEVGDWAPDDVIPYQALERQWQARPGTKATAPQGAAGRFLEKPVLHYSIGTRVTPRVIETLKKHGVPAVHSHAEAPPFEADFQRGMANVAQDPDWMGSYQSDSLLRGVHRGAVSDSSGSSYVPALAKGIGFGETGLTKGWKP